MEKKKGLILQQACQEYIDDNKVVFLAECICDDYGTSEVGLIEALKLIETGIYMVAIKQSS